MIHKMYNYQYIINFIYCNLRYVGTLYKIRQLLIITLTLKRPKKSNTGLFRVAIYLSLLINKHNNT